MNGTGQCRLLWLDDIALYFFMPCVNFMLKSFNYVVYL